MTETFSGFSPETMEFFMAIRFNNNRDFFHTNHDWYDRAVRKPLVALSRDVSRTLLDIDPEIDVRPVRTVSHINRDIRYSNDKSPYRDYMWLHFGRSCEDKDSFPAFYFDIGTNGVGCGMGIYRHNKPLMNALRYEILRNPEQVKRALTTLGNTYTVSTDRFKRMTIPDSVPEDLRFWYPMKGFAFGKQASDQELINSPALCEWLITSLKELAPAYRFLLSLTPIEEIPDDPASIEVP